MHTAAGAGTGERTGTGQAVREAVREAAQLQRRCRGAAEEVQRRRQKELEVDRASASRCCAV